MNEIKAIVLADSICNGKRITTFELEYPRYIHSQVLTHRMFSRNSASSRAIPVERMIDLVESNPVIPTHWGKNQSGMQAYEEVDNPTKNNAISVWQEAKLQAVRHARYLNQLGIHKQVVNRLLEPFQMIKVVLTATEFDNFFKLRLAHDSQPEIQQLAQTMLKALSNSIPMVLTKGQWHLPYVDREQVNDDIKYSVNGTELSLTDAVAVSVSCCAQVSYRKLDDSLEKANKLFKYMLTNQHLSPFEHQAYPANHQLDQSNNFIGWIQYRSVLSEQD